MLRKENLRDFSTLGSLYIYTDTTFISSFKFDLYTQYLIDLRIQSASRVHPNSYPTSYSHLLCVAFFLDKPKPPPSKKFLKKGL